MSNCSAFHVGRIGMALVHLGARRGFQAVEEIVRLDPKPFATANLNVWLAGFLLAERVAEFGGAARAECDDLVGEMDRLVRLPLVAEYAQPRHNDSLQI